MSDRSSSHDGDDQSPDYVAARRAAGAPDPADRRELAARPGVPAEILYFLARDSAAEVRAEVARNPDTPLKADLLLTADDDDRVRADIVGKTVSRIADNAVEDAPPQPRLIVDILMQLAADPKPQIRALLSRATRECRNLPAKVARCLAMDRDGRVAAPMVESSPVLSDDDLLSILDLGPPDQVTMSMSRRSRLSTRVAAGIVKTGNSEAIGSLLANHSAQIREETLDAVLEHAPDHPSWHRPLVYRPALTGGAIRKLSRFVAQGLVEALRGRPDIDPATADALTESLRTRLTTDSHPLDRGPPLDLIQPVDVPSSRHGRPAKDTSVARARTLHQQGLLTADDIDDAVFAGDRPFIATALALMSGAPTGAVDAVFDARSPKGIVALCWKAGLPMRLAIKVQTHIGHIQPHAVLHARDGADYPMSRRDLTRQLAFFGIKAD